jgi:hypothetical protein
MESPSSRNKNRTKGFSEETHEFFPLLRKQNVVIIGRNFDEAENCIENMLVLNSIRISLFRSINRYVCKKNVEIL